MRPKELLDTTNKSEEFVGSGIYAIYSIVSEKIYIGSSKNLMYRLARHKRDLKNQNHENIHLQRAHNKYKAKNLKYFVLEKTESLIEREKYYLRLIDNDLLYNIVPIDRIENPPINRKLTDEQVIEIKTRLLNGERNNAICKDMKISSCVVSGIKVGKYWNDIGPKLNLPKRLASNLNVEMVHEIRKFIEDGNGFRTTIKKFKIGQQAYLGIRYLRGPFKEVLKGKKPLPKGVANLKRIPEEKILSIKSGLSKNIPSKKIAENHNVSYWYVNSLRKLSLKDSKEEEKI